MTMNLLKFVLACVIFSTSLYAQETISLYYNERAPYLETVDEGIVKGLSATPAALAFQKAGIPFVWKKLPSKRQMNVLKSNTGQDCLVGWFKNAEREKFARYTLPIYQDKPTIGLALFSNTLLETGVTLESVLNKQKIRLLVKDGYSYGSYIDAKINALNPKRIPTTAENTNMIQMLYVDRADYMFIAEEEAETLIKRAGYKKEEFKYVTFSDVPKGNHRYILCSQQVGPSVIEKLNAVIQTYPFNQKH